LTSFDYYYFFSTFFFSSSSQRDRVHCFRLFIHHKITKPFSISSFFFLLIFFLPSYLASADSAPHKRISLLRNEGYAAHSSFLAELGNGTGASQA
jgi:hypothetical protein